MNKCFFNKIIFIISSTILILVLMTIKSNAAKLSISTSKSTVSPGEKFTVTVSVSGGAGSVSASVSNGTGGKTDFLDNSSFSFTCTAGSSGSVTIKASGTVADYTTEKDESKSATKTVTIKEPEQPKPSTSGGNSSSSSSSSSGGNSSSSSSGNTNKPTTTKKPNTSEEKETPKSSDSTLKSLSVIEGTISPEFNKDVREYTLTVPNEIGGANVTAIPTDSKASVSVTGNVGLKEGENTVTIIVVAEDGSSSKYLIRVTRLRPELSLQSLVVKYKNQEGELVELLLNPAFNFQTYEYTLEDLEYWVEKLEIDAIANIEGATVEVQGADALIEGENAVTITAKVPAEVAEQKEEIKTYIIKFNKKSEPLPPTLMGRISNWFNGIFGGVSVWYNQNQEQVVLGALGACVIALLGLSVYIVIDYKKYKTLIQKLKTLNEMNVSQVVNVNENKIEAKENAELKDNLEQIKNNEENNKKDKSKGRHF